MTDAVNAAAEVFQVTEPTEAVRTAVLNHIRSIQANARAATTQDMQPPLAEKKPAIAEAVASEAAAEAVQTVEASGVTEIPAEAVEPIVADMAEAAVEAGIQAAEAAQAELDMEAEEAEATDDAGVLYSERTLLTTMTEAAQTAAEEAYVGTDEATRAVLARVAEGVARVAEERVSWEVAVSEARGRQADAGVHEIHVEDVPTTLQFQMRTSIEKRNDGLMAVHNLKAQELLKTLRLGGFPMPSIAVIKAATRHNDYGDVSIVFGRDTVDPRVDPENRLYGADAWTPTFPQIDTEIDMDALYDMRRDIAETITARDAYLAQQAKGYFNRFVGNEWTSENRESLLDSAWNNEGLLAAYMLEKRRTFDIAQKHEAIERGYKPEYADMYDAILDALAGEDTKGLKPRELVETYGERLAATSDELNRLVTWANNGDRRAAVSIANRIREARAYESAGRDSTLLTRLVNDYIATRKALQDAIERANFEGWMTEKLNGFMGQEGVNKGVDPYTRDGSRKTFRQTHMAVTAENIVKAMKAQEERSSDATTAKGLMAAAAKRFGSIEEMRGVAYRLGEIGEEEYKALIAQADELLEKFMAAVGARNYFKQEEAGYLLVEAAKKKLDAASIAKLFKKNGFPVADLAAGRMAETIIKRVQEMPTGYFEAKPYRVVGFDEVRMVVAPQSMPAELAAELERRGIPYTTYDGTAEDRMVKMNAVEGVQFSIRRLPDGEQYVHIENNSHIFDGKQETEYPKIVRDYMRQHYRNKVIGNKIRAYMRKDAEGEYTNPAKHGMKQDAYIAKLRASTELANILDASTHIAHEQDDGRHPDAVNGWDKYRTIFEVMGKFYQGTIAVKQINRGAVFYDLTQIKDITLPMLAEYSEELKHQGPNDVFDNSMPQDDVSVKQYSERTTPTPSLRETLLSMEETPDMTATEKELLAKYKVLVADYRELEGQVEAQRTPRRFSAESCPHRPVSSTRIHHLWQLPQNPLPIPAGM